MLNGALVVDAVAPAVSATVPLTLWPAPSADVTIGDGQLAMAAISRRTVRVLTCSRAASSSSVNSSVMARGRPAVSSCGPQAFLDDGGGAPLVGHRGGDAGQGAAPLAPASRAGR